MGDAIAVVVSEERGTISLAVDGRLFELSNADALRSQLYRLLLPEGSGEKRSFREWLHDLFIKDSSEEQKSRPRRKLFGRSDLPRQQRFGLAIFSFILAFFIWLYVQVTIDPVTSTQFSVPLTFHGVETATEQGFGIQGYPVNDIQLVLRGRSEVLNDISVTDLTAYIDVSNVNQIGVIELPVEIETDTLLYTQTETVLPGSVRVNVYELQP